MELCHFTNYFTKITLICKLYYLTAPNVISSALDSKCFHTNQSSKGKTFTAPSTSTYELQIIDPNKTDNAALIAAKQ